MGIQAVRKEEEQKEPQKVDHCKCCLVDCLCCVGVGGVVGDGAVIVGVEELQPISVAGNPVGQCPSFKLLKTHPQSHLGPKITLSCFKIIYIMP